MLLTERSPLGYTPAGGGAAALALLLHPRRGGALSIWG